MCQLMWCHFKQTCEKTERWLMVWMKCSQKGKKLHSNIAYTFLLLRIRKLRLGFTAKLHIFTLISLRTANTNPCISHTQRGRESEGEKRNEYTSCEISIWTGGFVCLDQRLGHTKNLRNDCSHFSQYWESINQTCTHI